MSNELSFVSFSFEGADAQKFLQGQVTVNVEKLPLHQSTYTAICDLKGRIHFGLWLNKQNDEQFTIVTTQDQSEEFEKHIKKYGAFSKAKLVGLGQVYPTVDQLNTNFSNDITDIHAWQLQAIESGQAWISQVSEHLFQPQELRLHQRNGVNYDKGCYLGQEIIARLWFKAKPKHWLHLVLGNGSAPAIAEQLSKDVQVVNSVNLENGSYKALVVAKPEALEELSLTVLDLPYPLNQDVARPKA